MGRVFARLNPHQFRIPDMFCIGGTLWGGGIGHSQILDVRQVEPGWSAYAEPQVIT
jgi:hypothetical protein